jgi:anti-sigma28 factor (negative regulator of flagellin synthesis)
MQVHAQSNSVAVAAVSSNANAAAFKKATANVQKTQPKDQVTLSPAAKAISKNGSSESVSNTDAVEKAINSGNYTVLGTMAGGSVAIVLIDIIS